MKTICRNARGFERAIAMILLVCATLLIFVSAVMRYAGVPLNWSLELSLFMFAWCVFLSADVALREDRMVNLDLFVNLLPKRAKSALAVLCLTVILAFLAVLAGYGFGFAWKTRVRTFHGIDFSYAWVTASLPIASLLMGITAVGKLRGHWRSLAGGDARSASEESAR